MGEDIEELVLRVRSDTSGFKRDVAAMRGELEGPLAAGVTRAGRTIESALLRAVGTGKFGFDDLKRVALQALGEIAAAALKAVLAPSGPGAGSGGLLASLVGAASGAPGRATGGPVSGGRAFLVGERGPELFVPPGGGGRIVAARDGGAREVRINVAINGARGEAPRLLSRSARQVARAVGRTLGR